MNSCLLTSWVFQMSPRTSQFCCLNWTCGSSQSQGLYNGPIWWNVWHQSDFPPQLLWEPCHVGQADRAWTVELSWAPGRYLDTSDGSPRNNYSLVKMIWGFILTASEKKIKKDFEDVTLYSNYTHREKKKRNDLELAAS